MSCRLESNLLAAAAGGAWLTGVKADLADALTSRVTFAIPLPVTALTASEAFQVGFVFHVARNQCPRLATSALRFFLTSQPRQSYWSWDGSVASRFGPHPSSTTNARAFVCLLAQQQSVKYPASTFTSEEAGKMAVDVAAVAGQLEATLDPAKQRQGNIAHRTDETRNFKS
jgi:hypothetical protein